MHRHTGYDRKRFRQSRPSARHDAPSPEAVLPTCFPRNIGAEKARLGLAAGRDGAEQPLQFDWRTAARRLATPDAALKKVKSRVAAQRGLP